MLARMMLIGANVLILDEPTNHLDLESITSLNNGLIAFPEVILFASHDHECVATVANRIIEIGHKGVIDKMINFDDYLADEAIAAQREQIYHQDKAAVGELFCCQSVTGALVFLLESEKSAGQEKEGHQPA